MFSLLTAIVLVAAPAAAQSEGRVQKLMADLAGCEPKQVVVVELDTPDNWVWSAKGCGREAMFEWVPEAIDRDPGSSYIHDLELRKRAPFDLACEEVEYHYLGFRVRGASGCGRRATYLKPDSFWALNGTVLAVRPDAPSLPQKTESEH